MRSYWDQIRGEHAGWESAQLSFTVARRNLFSKASISPLISAISFGNREFRTKNQQKYGKICHACLSARHKSNYSNQCSFKGEAYSTSRMQVKNQPQPVCIIDYIIWAYGITYYIKIGRLCFAQRQKRAHLVPALSCIRHQHTDSLCHNISRAHGFLSSRSYQNGSAPCGATWSNESTPAEPVPTKASHCLLCCTRYGERTRNEPSRDTYLQEEYEKLANRALQHKPVRNLLSKHIKRHKGILGEYMN
jgi:hypothetical protein